MSFVWDIIKFVAKTAEHYAKRALNAYEVRWQYERMTAEERAAFREWQRKTWEGKRKSGY